jgi:hypothetical protein
MLPDRKAIRDLFEGLLGREVDLDDGRPVDLGMPKPVVASYVDDTQQLRAVALMSFGLAARSGAAIALIPPGAVEAAEEDRLLPVNLFENASEICNVLAAPLGDALGVHLRLASTYSPSESIPAHVLHLAASVGVREDVALDITGYGSGELSLVVSV